MRGTRKAQCRCGCDRIVYGRNQYHAECKWIIHEKEKARERERRLEERASGKKPRLRCGAVISNRGPDAATAPRARTAICRDCMNLAHRRPESGCPGCKLPFADELVVTPLRGFSAIDTARKWA